MLFESGKEGKTSSSISGMWQGVSKRIKRKEKWKAKGKGKKEKVQSIKVKSIKKK